MIPSLKTTLNKDSERLRRRRVLASSASSAPRSNLTGANSAASRRHGQEEKLRFAPCAVEYVHSALQQYVCRLCDDIKHEKGCLEGQTDKKVLWCGRRGRNIREVPAMTQMIDIGLGGPGEGGRGRPVMVLKFHLLPLPSLADQSLRHQAACWL